MFLLPLTSYLITFQEIMKLISFLYQWLVAIPLLVVITIVIALATSIGSILFGGKWWGYYPPHLWAKCWCRLFFIKVRVEGREHIDPATSYVFVANHQSSYDIYSIYGYLGHNFKWMMKKSLEKVPFVGVACRCAGHIMVDRSSAAAVKRTMETAKQRLQGGMSLVVFPEGARTWDGKMRGFKRGAFKLAMDFNLPIVPITINGAFEVMPRTTYQIKPFGTITLTIHRPIEHNGEDLDTIMAQCHSIIESRLNK